MNSLLYLAFLKVKGLVRNQFRTPGSAIISVLMILLYGGLVFMSFFFLRTRFPRRCCWIPTGLFWQVLE